MARGGAGQAPPGPPPAVRLKPAYDDPSRSDGVRVLGGAPLAARPQQGERRRRPLAQGRGAEHRAPQAGSAMIRRSGSSSAAATATNCAAGRRSWSNCAGSPATGTVTSVYGAKDTEHNSAVVLREMVEEQRRSAAA